MAAIALLAAMLLAGCGGNETRRRLPRRRQSSRPRRCPTWTPVRRGSFPRPRPRPKTADRTPGGASTGRCWRTPFPPTWTPGSPPSATPRKSPTPVVPTLPPAPTWTTHPDYCFALTVVGGDLATRAGVAVTVRWTPIAEFSDYVVIVRHPGGGIIYSGTATGGTLLLPSDLFTVAGAYGWEVWPLDAAGNRTCFAVGGDHRQLLTAGGEQPFCPDAN